MGQQLFTQTISSLPQVLIIGDSSRLISDLIVGVEKIFQQNGLACVILDEKLIKELIDQDFYKIIWIVNSNKTSDENKKIGEWLKSRTEPSLCLVTGDTVIDAEAISLWEWKKNSFNQQQVINYLINLLPNTTFCVGVDLLTREDSPLFKLLTTHLVSGEIVSTTLIINPQTIHGFLSTSSKLLLSPWSGQKWAIKGQGMALSQLVSGAAKLIEGIWGKKIDVREVAIKKAINGWDNFEIIINQQDDFQTKVGEWLKKWARENQPRQLAKTPSSTLPKPRKIPNVREERIIKSEAPAVVVNQTSHSSQEIISSLQLDSAVDRLFSQHRVEKKTEKINYLSQEKNVFKRKTQKRSRVFWGGLFFTGVGLGGLFLVMILVANTWALTNRLLKLAENSGESLTSNSPPAFQQNLLRVMEAQVGVYKPIFNDWIQYQIGLVEVNKQAVNYQQELKSIQNLVIQASQSILGKDSGDSAVLVEVAAKRSELVYKQLSLLQAALKQFDDTDLTSQQKAILSQFANRLEEERKKILVLQQVAPALASFLSSTEKKTLAILIQDSQELRATGGFVQGVIIITLDRGVIVDRQIFSSYTIDESLPGKVQAPSELAKQLNEKQLYLRDANWDADFPSSAQTIAWFVEKAVNRKIDGVIALDSYAIKNLIGVVGPLNLPQYNEVITEKNLFERTEFHSEVTLQNNITQPEYLTAVSTELLNQIFAISSEKTPLLLAAFMADLNTNHLLISSFDSNLNKSFESFGWTGGILTPNCPAELAGGNCLVDTIAQVETNIGINKANYSVSRNIAHSIFIEGSQVKHERRVILTNNASSTAWPKGDYKLFLRFYLSSQANVTNIVVDGIKVPINISMEHDKKVASINLTVPIQKTVELVLNYDTPLAANGDFSYIFFDQKQPGTADDNQTIVFQYPATLVPTVIAPQAEVSENKITFSQSKKTNLFVGAKFSFSGQ